MINKVSDGLTINYTNTGSAISAGDVVVMGNFCGVAITDIAASTGVGAVAITGVYTLTKKTIGVDVAIGDIIADDSGPVVVTAGDDLVAANIIGRAVSLSGTATTTVDVKLGL